MSVRVLLTVLAAAVLVAACDGGDSGSEPAPPDSPTTSSPAAPGEPGSTAFDAEAARAEAEALLGTPEGEIEESPDLRIARRGEENFALTQDLVPGRMNVELDDDGTGTYVVTRVVVETPADQEPIVVE